MSEPVDDPEPLERPAPGSAESTPTPRRSAFRGLPWRPVDVLIGLAPLVAMRAVAALPVPDSLPGGLRFLWIPLALLAQAWMFAYPWRIAARRAGVPRLPGPRAWLVEGLVAAAVWVAVMLAWNLAYVAMSLASGEAVRPTQPLAPLARSPHGFEVLTLVILTVAVAPVAEEVFYRGMLYNALRRRFPVALAAPLQAIVFGLLHPFAFADVVGIAVAGLGFALVYEWRKSLLTPVLLHTMVNGVGIAVMMWGLAGDAYGPKLGVRGGAHQGGCLVTEVSPGSPAEEAGLKVGDVINALDGDPVADFPALVQAVRRRRVGDAVALEIIRDGTPRRIDAVLRSLRE